MVYGMPVSGLQMLRRQGAEMTDELPPPPRIVKPRNRKYKRLPVVVVSGGMCISEDAQLEPADKLTFDLHTRDSTLFVTLGAGDFVAGLNDIFSVSHPDSWQWRVTEQEKNIVKPGGFRVAARVTTVVHYFGFKGGNYHKVIDPVVMYGRKLDDVWPGDAPEATKLMLWGRSIRDFCDENCMEVRPTIGSMSAQFLTDRRFYPRARRKVPYLINERARPEQPANYYALGVTPSTREFTAWYLDQRRAHHYHARTTHLPDANDLHAHGRFVDLAEITFDRIEPDFCGLYCLHLQLPKNRERMLHWIRPEAPYDFVFSNELPLLLDMGYRVNGVIAAWGSHQQDTGLRRYACWADQQLDNYADAPWVKPLLLATYGTLATRPSWGETIFRLAKRGEPAQIHTGHKHLSGLQTRAPKRLEPKIANVIHRGMIEAATRADSIGLAHWLMQQRFRVLSIYADAVIVQDDDESTLPDLPEPWRLKTTLNHLQFINKQAFVSGEMTKIPGVNRELLKYSRAYRSVPFRKLWNPATGRPWNKKEMKKHGIKPRRI